MDWTLKIGDFVKLRSHYFGPHEIGRIVGQSSYYRVKFAGIETIHMLLAVEI